MSNKDFVSQQRMLIDVTRGPEELFCTVNIGPLTVRVGNDDAEVLYGKLGYFFEVKAKPVVPVDLLECLEEMEHILTRLKTDWERTENREQSEAADKHRLTVYARYLIASLKRTL